MGPFDRGLLLLYSLCISIILAVLVLMLAGWQPALELSREVFSPQQREVLYAVTAVLLIAGLRLIYASVKVRRPQSRTALVEDNPLGQVQVALTAIESLVSKVVANFPGVREVRPKVTQVPQGIAIKIKLVTAPSASIPELSQEIQQQVMDTVKNITGITTNNVQVLVDNISTAKPRVE
ncbi:MAG TPA: alkaline shock response membrane anchor protein AmaP [Desulfotomaculum sp.]|nr:alkaline shock response membrane anchor protein AmaP [Desulfotomaculum sp.]